MGRDLLESSSLVQYEVSNFARPGKRSLHNIRYWRMENWLGIGPAASGTLINNETGAGRRYTVRPDVEAYLKDFSRDSVTIEELDPLTLIQESFLMGFRYVEGPDRSLFKTRFGKEPEAFIPRTTERWRKRGLMDNEKPALNREGLLLLNPFLLEAFAELGRL
jgi:oxygen-independent coproporphyrinogen-3 oxidase